MGVCEFCSKEVEAIEGTSMTGAYCIDCLRLTIAECRSAIKVLKKQKQSQGKKPKGQRARENNPSVEEKYNEALNNLISGPKDA